MRWLPELRYLEGTEHDEDDAPALDGTDGTRRVRSSVTHLVDVVKQRHGSRHAKGEIGLKSKVIIFFFPLFPLRLMRREEDTYMQRLCPFARRGRCVYELGSRSDMNGARVNTYMQGEFWPDTVRRCDERL